MDMTPDRLTRTAGYDLLNDGYGPSKTPTYADPNNGGTGTTKDQLPKVDIFSPDNHSLITVLWPNVKVNDSGNKGSPSNPVNPDNCTNCGAKCPGQVMDHKCGSPGCGQFHQKPCAEPLNLLGNPSIVKGPLIPAKPGHGDLI